MSNTSLDSATGPRPVPCPRSDSTSGPTMAEKPSSCRAEHDCINVMDAHILGLQPRRIAEMDQRFLQSPAAG